MVLRILGHFYKETVDMNGYPLATIKYNRSIWEGILTVDTYNIFAKFSGPKIYTGIV